MTQFPQAAEQAETPRVKQAYHTPELRDYGTIGDLTLGSSTNVNNPQDSKITVLAPDGIPIYLT